MCAESNIKFIGPSSEIIEKMGNKLNAKKLMDEIGVPTVPGSKGSVDTYEEAKKCAEEIGLPIILKAANGGGGKGIRIVYELKELEDAYNVVKAEALISFNDKEIYIEKFVENPRHVEIQILADEYGNAITLGERDCSIQRKNQKMLEESPSTFIDEKTRKKMCKAALNVAKATNYASAGTVEFIVDKNKNFYFMEMNTRLQVEHPVTEFVTGMDIVKWQIRIAFGEKLNISNKEVQFKGHSIECRVNAETPSKKFMPSPGKITSLHLPGGNGVRVDSHIYAGYTIPQNYDSMIAKIIVHAETRQEAINKMKCAIGETIIEGIDTNVDFLFEILSNENFEKGNFSTKFIAEEFA
jgi:acetyl-CoA carboxylase biotin carboxylase subunit